jgi:hypothetical protein
VVRIRSEHPDVPVAEKHSMVRRPSDWHELASDAVRSMRDVASERQVARVMAASPGDRLGVALAGHA